MPIGLVSVAQKQAFSVSDIFIEITRSKVTFIANS